ncbi:unnamed protein product [Albugo candida]|uniref:Protein kinase domain-containing protein n=1 Tax=Albugo candida TaxID=65357 RepID=A0A024GBU2_9STRA|nr:unnamed protein product [Albugo candida]|eukprot:CCI44139.1 unnamed protein product [Albugo candida]
MVDAIIQLWAMGLVFVMKDTSHQVDAHCVRKDGISILKRCRVNVLHNTLGLIAYPVLSALLMVTAILEKKEMEDAFATLDGPIQIIVWAVIAMMECMVLVDVIVNAAGILQRIALIVSTAFMGQSVWNALKIVVTAFVRAGKTVQDSVFAWMDGILTRHLRAHHVRMAILVLIANYVQAMCQCDARYTGSGCEIYDFPLMMVMILGTIALTTLGFCMCTMRRLARQPRNYRRPFPHHQSSSFSRSEYVEIAGMSDLEYFVSNDSRDWLVPFESLTLQSEVGNGTSGQVFKSLLHCGGGNSVVAVKRLYSPVTGQEYFQSFFRREVGILSRLHHPNVVRFYGVSYYNRVLYIVTDFCPKSLNHLIEDPTARGQIEKSFFIKIITQVVSGMGFLHSRSVVHRFEALVPFGNWFLILIACGYHIRDLKPANVLISDRNDVNICDFGLSRLIDPEMTSMTAEVGTPSYMAPEMATMGGIQCSTKGDVYSFGILLYTTWSRSKPYGDQGMNPFQLMAAVVNGLRPVIPINCPPGLARLMRACWDMKPEKRPTFPEISLILKDEWLLASGTEEEFPFGGGVARNLCNISTTSSAATTTAVFRRCSSDGDSPSVVNMTHRMSEVEEEATPLLTLKDEGLS